MKKPSLTAVVVVIIIIGVVYYVYFRRPKVPTGADYSAIPAPPTTAAVAAPAMSSAPADVLDYNAVMKRGDKGQNVRYIQQGLNRIAKLRGDTPLVVDEDFGGKTETALLKYLNKKSASYAQVKAAVIKKYADAGKPNPYTSGTSGTSSTGATNSAATNAALSTTFPLSHAYLSSVAGMF